MGVRTDVVSYRIATIIGKKKDKLLREKIINSLMEDTYLGALRKSMDDFRAEPVRLWMVNHIEVPVVVTVLYMILVLYVPEHVMAFRQAFNLRSWNILWNLILTVFSFFGAYFTLPQMYRLTFKSNVLMPNMDNTGMELRQGSLYNCVCQWNPNLFYNGPVGLFVCLFILSKIPEMMDTVFLVLQKKRVIFLHWYHHITVMLYCWHAYIYVITGGLAFASMNYGVHSVMYFYYFMCACGLRKYVRPFAPLITALQIAQMVIGLYVELFSAYHMYFTKSGCHSNESNIRLGTCMYFSYFILFCKLFKDSYLSKSTKDSAKSLKRDEVASHTNGKAKKQASLY